MNKVWAALMAVFCSLFHFSLWFVARRGVSDAGPRRRRLVLQLCSEAMCEKSVPCEADTRRDLHDVDGAAVLSLPTRCPVKLWAVLFPCLCFEKGPWTKEAAYQLHFHM